MEKDDIEKTGKEQGKAEWRHPPKEYQFKKGISGNPKGTPKLTPEQKKIRKETKLIIAEYIDNLQRELPQIKPVLLKEALKGNIIAIREIHDRAMGKPKMFVEGSASDQTINAILEKLADVLK